MVYGRRKRKMVYSLYLKRFVRAVRCRKDMEAVFIQPSPAPPWARRGIGTVPLILLKPGVDSVFVKMFKPGVE